MVKETFERCLETQPKMKAGELIIRLSCAKHIKGQEFLCLQIGKGDIYASLSIGGEKRKSKVAIRGGVNPVWEEQLSFKIAEHVHFGMYNLLLVSLFDHDPRKDSPRGCARIEVANLLEAHKNDVPLQSYPVIHKGKNRGTVELGITFIPSEKKGAKATVKSP